jgi:hypothetical protein
MVQEDNVDSFTDIGAPLTTLDRIQYVIDTAEKETKQETKLVKQLFYAGMSTYTNDPINLMVNSRKPGQGKSHPITRVLEYFPKEDVILLAGSSDKALYHEKGPLVIQDPETERWIPIQPQLDEFESREHEVKKQYESKSISASVRDDRLKEIKIQRDELLSQTSKLISLEHKIIVFLDTPNTTLLEALMPLLSHDAYESKYKFTDKKGASGKLEGTDNILWGWPTIILAQTLDITHRKRFPELARRFIIVNPSTTQEKVNSSVDLAIDSGSLPDLAYQAEVVTDRAKSKAKAVVRDLKQEFLEFAKGLRQPNGQYDKNKSAVLCPFDFALKAAMPKNEMNDVTNVKRFLRFQTLSTITNVDRRPIIRAAFNPAALDKTSEIVASAKDMKDMIDIPIVAFADTIKAIELMQDASNTGLRPEQINWYHQVFLKAFDAKKEPSWKYDEASKKKYPLHEEDWVRIQEDRKALTTQELTIATQKYLHEIVESKRIRDDYLEPLYNNGLIEKVGSKLDKRQNIYFPLSELFEQEESSQQNNVSVNNKKLHRNEVRRNFLEDSKLHIRDITALPTQESIKSRIRQVTKYYAEKGYIVKVVNGRNNDSEAELNSIASIYYSDLHREQCFELKPSSEDHTSAYYFSNGENGNES